MMAIWNRSDSITARGGFYVVDSPETCNEVRYAGTSDFNVFKKCISIARWYINEMLSVTILSRGRAMIFIDCFCLVLAEEVNNRREREREYTDTKTRVRRGGFFPFL